jgi:hypothetical protein
MGPLRPRVWLMGPILIGPVGPHLGGPLQSHRGLRKGLSSTEKKKRAYRKSGLTAL